MTTLPPPTIDVTQTENAERGEKPHNTGVSIYRERGKARHYTGEGRTVPESVQDAFRKVLGDPRNAEFI